MKPILIKRSTAAFILLSVLNLLVALSAFYVLPKRFFYDAVIIAFDKGNEIGFFGSYPLTILFYKISAMRYLPFPLVGLIQFPILMYLLYLIGIPKDFEKLDLRNLLVYLGIFMMAVYICMPSKEFINFPFICLIVFLFRSPRIQWTLSVGLSFLLLLVFGIFYRPYYVLIPLLALVMYVASLLNFKHKSFSVVFYGLLAALLLSFSYALVSGHFFSEIGREAINNERMGSADAHSMIVSPLKADTWYGEAVGILYGFFTVNIPLNGLKYLLSPQILLFVFWQLSLFYLLWLRFSRCLHYRQKHIKELWILLILFAFFIVQGVFEPDLGSAVRHKIGVFPLIYYALYYDHFRKKL